MSGDDHGAALQAALRHTCRRDDLRLYFSTGALAGPASTERTPTGQSAGGHVRARLRRVLDENAVVWELGMGHNLRGSIDFEARTAHYRIGTGPWRIARHDQVFTANEKGEDVGPRPRIEPSPFDVIAVIARMDVGSVQRTMALGVECTRYQGEAYDAGREAAPDRRVPRAWGTAAPLACSVWHDRSGLIRQTEMIAISDSTGLRLSTEMLLAPRHSWRT